MGSMIGVRNDPRAWVRVANTVAERIASGDIAPGEPVPSKPDLAAELGCRRIRSEARSGSLRPRA